MLRLSCGAANSPLFGLDPTGALILAIVAGRPSQTKVSPATANAGNYINIVRTCIARVVYWLVGNNIIFTVWVLS